MRHFCLLSGFVCLASVTVPTLADDSASGVNIRRFEDRPSTRDALSGLLHYPKDIRDAALDISQYPDLVINLRYGSADPAQREKMLASYPVSVQTSARLVASRGDALATLERHLLTINSLGKTYRQDPAAVRAIVDRMSEQSAFENKLATDAWGKRLEKDPTAAQQFIASADELAKASGTLAFDKQAMPTPDQARYVLVHADRFPELAGQIVDQWEIEKNTEPFRQAVDMWYAQRRDNLPEHFGMDVAQRNMILKEQAIFETKYADAVRTSQHIPPTRAEFLDQHGKEFPYLSEVQSYRAFVVAEASKPVRVGGGPWTGSSGSGGSSSKSSSSSSRSGASTMGTSSSRSGSRSSSSSGSNSRNNSSGSNNNSRNSSRSSNNRSSGSNNSGFGGNSGSGFGSGGSGFGSGFGGGGSSFGGGSGSSFGSGSSNRSSNR